MQEATIESCVCDYAEKRGVYVRKAQWLGRRGAPDRFMAKGGRIALIEFKRPGRKPDRLQKKEHERLARAGVHTEVIDDVDKGILFIDGYFLSARNASVS